MIFSLLTALCYERFYSYFLQKKKNYIYKIRAKTAAYHVKFQFQMKILERNEKVLGGCAVNTLSFHDGTLTCKPDKKFKNVTN